MTVALPLLRDDIRVVRGVDDVHGWPTFILQDIVRGRYFHLGWPEFEILSRWGAGEPDVIAQKVSGETTLTVDGEFVRSLGDFLRRNGLTKVVDDRDFDVLRQARQASRRNLATWLLHHYLYIKVPLIRPDRHIARLETIVRPVLRYMLPAFGVVAAVAAVVLAIDFEAFVSTFPDHVSAWGLLTFAFALLTTKAAHELGHALALKHFGGTVPTMGIALVVLFPMLYTDTSSGWFLRCRRQRIIVALSGIGAELGLAAMSVLIWAIVPDGDIRTTAFFVATTALIGTLLINISPFLKFDGYYVLADLLNVPNLHDRAFTEGRNALRGWLFAAPPGRDPSRLGTALLVFALATWIYRLIIFSGIAVMVYLMTFKALGIILFLIEIWWFILRPVLSEARQWWQGGLTLPLHRRLILIGCAIAAFLLVAIPWRQSVQAPAVLQAKPLHRVVATNAGLIVSTELLEGRNVEPGSILYIIDEADQRHQRRLAQIDAEGALKRVERAQIAVEFLRETALAEQRLNRSLSEMEGLAERATRSQVTAPIAGIVRDVRDGIAPGRWIGVGDPLAVIVGDGTEVVAYLSEAEVVGIRSGAKGRFIPADPMAPRVELQVVSVGSAATTNLETRMLSSTNGGNIAVWPMDEGKKLVPVNATYKVLLASDGMAGFSSEMAGTAEIEVAARSIAARVLLPLINRLASEWSF